MNSSNPCLQNKIISEIEFPPLHARSSHWQRHKWQQAYPDLSLDAERKLLVEPDGDRAALLQQAENEVDGSQQGLSGRHGDELEL